MNKYYNKKIKIDGINFDSKLEAKRYQQLKLMEQTGSIKDLVLQPKYELLKGFKRRGKTYLKVTYIADFIYFDNEKKRQVIEDVKGFETPVFKLKLKFFLAHLDDNIDFLLVKNNEVKEY
ncbi:MAG: DUF1064 domain-containing protein [Eubacteriales bacterium]|nr:DUF1064 domain-containing protein [Eubacteriales bacterium]